MVGRDLLCLRVYAQRRCRNYGDRTGDGHHARPRLGDLFAFCGSFSVRIKQWSLNVPHINDVSTNVLFTCRNHIFLHVWTRSPQKIRTLLKNVLCIPKSMRATAKLIMSVRSGLGSWKTDEKPNCSFLSCSECVFQCQEHAGTSPPPANMLLSGAVFSLTLTLRPRAPTNFFLY
jgi:hypothetical protein